MAESVSPRWPIPAQRQDPEVIQLCEECEHAPAGSDGLCHDCRVVIMAITVRLKEEDADTPHHDYEGDQW